MLFYVVLDYEKGMCLNSPYTFGEKKIYIYEVSRVGCWNRVYFKQQPVALFYEIVNSCKKFVFFIFIVCL